MTNAESAVSYATKKHIDDTVKFRASESVFDISYHSARYAVAAATRNSTLALEDETRAQIIAFGEP